VWGGGRPSLSTIFLREEERKKKEGEGGSNQKNGVRRLLQHLHEKWTRNVLSSPKGKGEVKGLMGRKGTDLCSILPSSAAGEESEKN